jgi:preprotein translocase subunit SecE
MAENNDSVTTGKGRATPGRRNQTEAKSQGNFLTRTWRGFIEYLRDVRSELGKVTWPTREDVIRLTRIVLLVTVASAIALGLISFFFGQVLQIGIDLPILFAAIILGAVVVAFYLFWRSNRSAKGY